MLAAAGFFMLAIYYRWILPRLPDSVPTHFDVRGRVNGWTDKAHLPWLIFGIPLFLWLLFWVIGWIGSTIEKDSAKASASAAQPLRGFLGLGLSLLMVGCLDASMRGVGSIHLGAAAFFCCLILGIIFMALELKRFLAGQPAAEHYRWGLFYVNPDDSRLWVEKRLGVGWTLNYAHSGAWWLTALLLLPVVAGLVLVVLLQKG
jgi:uncharacterized membrane protein